MTDVDETLRFSKLDKWYLKTALDTASRQYDKQGEADHASAVRRIATRVEGHQTERRQPTEEDTQRWQQKMISHAGNHEKCRMVIWEWWYELCATAVDPAAALTEALLPMVDQAGKHTALQILVTIEQKMMALARDPQISDPEMAFQEVMRFIHAGQYDAQTGKPLWAEDPHLKAVVEQIRSQAQSH